MYDRVLVITINSYYSKVPSTGTAVLFLVPYRYRGTNLPTVKNHKLIYL